MSDEQIRRLERQARAQGVDAREAAAQFLGIERHRYAFAVFAGDGPISAGSRRALLRTYERHQPRPLEQWIWLTPLETLDEIGKNGWFFESGHILDLTARRHIPTGERFELSAHRLDETT